jgi:CO/xanthine dehydrogenase Mo-binding subunit
MITAEVLGLTAEEVRPSNTDTDSIGRTDVTGGSRTAFATGWAVHEAAQDALRQLKERAAKVWQVAPDRVNFADGRFINQADSGASMSLRELGPRLGQTGGPVVGRGTVHAGPMGAPAFSGCLVDLEVDPDTGKVQILRATVAQDAGRAIHPSYVEGQMQGGTAQGLGWALNEEYFYDQQGTMRNPGFLDYRIPTCLDLPAIETQLVEVANPDHPLGVRGVGEVSIVPPPAAVANALYRAAGVRMDELPMSPPRLLKAMLSK